MFDMNVCYSCITPSSSASASPVFCQLQASATNLCSSKILRSIWFWCVQSMVTAIVHSLTDFLSFDSQDITTFLFIFIQLLLYYPFTASLTLLVYYPLKISSFNFEVSLSIFLSLPFPICQEIASYWMVLSIILLQIIPKSVSLFSHTFTRYNSVIKNTGKQI